MINTQKQAFGKEIISHQDSDLIFPKGIDRKKTPTHIAIVHHIIVDKGCGMYEF